MRRVAVLAASQRRQPRRGLVVVSHPPKAGQHRVRADLDKQAMPRLPRRIEPGGKPHRRPQVPLPISGVRPLASREQLPADVRDQRHTRRSELHP